MSDQVNVGDYSLEISGDEVVVRDESGAIVEIAHRLAARPSSEASEPSSPRTSTMRWMWLR